MPPKAVEAGGGMSEAGSGGEEAGGVAVAEISEKKPAAFFVFEAQLASLIGISRETIRDIRRTRVSEAWGELEEGVWWSRPAVLELLARLRLDTRVINMIDQAVTDGCEGMVVKSARVVRHFLNPRIMAGDIDGFEVRIRCKDSGFYHIGSHVSVCHVQDDLFEVVKRG